MNCRLQVFKRLQTDEHSTMTYRFALLDLSKAESYPANFVCMLPLKVDQRKGKNPNVFSELFGDKSVDFAIALLNDALKRENDDEVKIELERRLKLMQPTQVNFVKCSLCKKAFQPHKVRRYKQNFCDDCLKAKYGYH